MSASHKKQLRKEQNAAQMTEKQREAQNEAKKLRLYSIAFVAVLVLLVLVAAVTAVSSSGIIERNTTAVTVDNTKVSAVELNYYYIDSINNYLGQWGDYLALTGLDSSKALDDQIFSEADNLTWADYFIQQATTNIHSVYSIYNKAIAEGYTLSEEDRQAIESNLSTTALYAQFYYGYADLNSYLVGMYGAGANEETYRAYAEVQYIASAYANDHYDTLEYTDEQIAAVLAENPFNYTSYNYNYYYLPSTDFLQGGTQGEDGKITYSDEEKAAALEAAKAAAESLVAQAAEINTDVLFDKAIKALNIKDDAAATVMKNKMYTTISATMQDWVADPDRVVGDLGMIANETTSTDADGNETTTTNGYYVILFLGANDNTYKMNNVRHLLVSFEGGTKGEDGTTVYSDEEKAAAKAEAEELLNQFLAGEQTEEAFAALVTEKTDDTASAETGGLFENIHLASNYVEGFLNWANDDARTVGETGIVETEYGYHVMYFVGESEESYRDALIITELRDKDMTAWEEGLVEASQMTVKTTNKVKTNLKLSSGN
ncbi:MAG: peptidylprolyl isomerase [Oscillospiraceae bacterium]|nr:peptidylprolyl isomerase [Oscillospiraceae bacterium]